MGAKTVLCMSWKREIVSVLTQTQADFEGPGLIKTFQFLIRVVKRLFEFKHVQLELITQKPVSATSCFQTVSVLGRLCLSVPT